MALEDGRVIEDRIIGQEMVPSNTRGVEVTRTVEVVTYRDEVESKDHEHEQKDTSPELIQDVDPAATSSLSMARPFVNPSFQGGNPVEDPGSRGDSGWRQGQMAAGARGEDPMSPLLPEALWPGGPSQQVPPIYGPASAGMSPPLFNFEQLRKLQELYAAAPYIYGQQTTTEVKRPQFLEDEENTLRARLREIENKKIEEKKKQEEASVQDEENRSLKEMMIMMKKENEQLRQLVVSMSAAGDTRGSTAVQKEGDMEFETPEEFKSMSKLGARMGARPTSGVEPEVPPRAEGSSDTVAVMLKLMEGMQALQEKMVVGSHKTTDYMETVKAPMDLPKLPPWDPESGPIDFNDWLALIQPYMEDLADTATEWWSEMLNQVQLWYDDHMTQTPLARLGHECKAPTSLVVKKWVRLERRASAMLMSALPEQIKDEVLSSRMVTTFGILCKLYVAYQPGGLAEKSLVLSALESPKEETTLGSGVAGLRKWIRWRRRARDIGVSIPDPTVLVRGLTKLTRRILGAHGDLAFRISLARNTLMMDSVPNHTTVGQFADHLLAELEQLHLQERKKRDPVPQLPDPKAKEVRMENEKGKGKGKGKDKGTKGDRREGTKGGGGDQEEPPKCRFYLSEQGCRKGRSCGWSHDQTDGRRRCYACGSTEHIAPECPRGASNSPTSSTAKAKVAKAEEDRKSVFADDASESSSIKPTDETMQQLLQEANKMLKGLQDKERPAELSSDDRMKALQQQLDELKCKSLKALKLTRITKGHVLGLLDSGATHPMRGHYPGERVGDYPVVMATLASGKEEAMRVSPTGVMVLEKTAVDRVEPIAPMGSLMRCLGCRVVWDKDYMKVWHPQHGDLKVRMINGCPQVSHRLALRLIKEIEDENGPILTGGVRSLAVDQRMKEMAWIRQLVNNHPAFDAVPEWIKSKLVSLPAEDISQLPANRRVRKLWSKEGCVLHLYAGPDEGYTMKRAFKEVGGHEKRMIELDIRRSEKHNLLDDHIYPSLLRLALDGKIEAVIGGPNCRTRSVLRSYEGGPPQARSWEENQVWGKHDASLEDLKKVEEDDELMFKMIAIYLVAKYTRKVEQWGKSKNTYFLLEQPDAPDYKPEVVSFWWTQQWAALQAAEGLQLVRMNQGDYGGQYIKPTGLGTDLNIQRGSGNSQAKGRSAGLCHDTKELARWTPGLCREIAKALLLAMGDEVRMRKMSWQEHLALGHTPFRRDCKICQEAAAKDRPHRRVPHPLAGCLSVDVTGPLITSKDQRGENRYMLIGAYTGLKLRDGEGDEVEEQEEAEPLEDSGDGQDVVFEAPEEDPGREEGPSEEADEHFPVEDPGREETAEEKKAKEDFKIQVFHLAVPLASRAAEVVLEAIIQMYLQLRMDGYYVRQLHSDRAKEFTTRTLQRWCMNRDIQKTTTAGDSPQQNGRAEKAVQSIKAKMRIALLACGWKADRWALACHYIHNLERSKMRPSMKRGPTLGSKVLVRKRFWKSRELEPTHTEVVYISPLPEVHGHLVLEANGKLAVTSYTLAHTVEPPNQEGTWIAVVKEAEDEEDALRIRRRIRGKTSVRVLSGEEIEEGSLRREMRVRQEDALAEESLKLMTDEETVAPVMFRQLKKAVVSPEQEGEDVLRTRIVSVFEFLREAELWRGAVEAEMRQLFEEKRALVRSTLAHVQGLKAAGRAVEIIPSKLVITLKPGPRRKVRIVACGNFLEFKGEELFAAGADSTALRMTLKVSAELRWRIMTVDIKVAFLNAPLVTTTKEQGMVQEDVMFALKPPSLLIRLGYARESEAWIAEKAMYGLRQSPRSWSIYRDQVMSELKIPGVVITQAVAEPNLWMLRTPEDEVLRGIILVYVDDMLISGQGDLPDLVLQQIQRVWQTSPPEEVVEGVKSKFLGMEIAKKGEILYALQTAYVEDRLETNLGGEWKEARDSSMPCPKEIEEVIEEDIQESQVREAQRIVGELLWLVTRTRPDVAYITSRLAQMVLKSPRMVVKLSDQVWRYLKATREEGLSFSPQKGEGWAGEDQLGLEAFSDASFAPGGGTSIGAVVIRWNGAVMQWRAGRQPYPTLSAAEAELTEATEALVMGDSFDALVSDLYHGYPKTVLVDNMAAINLLTEESGVWRTRHLRLRAHHMRWRITRMDWRVAHCPGLVMIADIGTKPLAATRLRDLKVLMGMVTPKEDEKTRDLGSGGEVQSQVGPILAEKVLRMILLASLIRAGSSQPDQDGEDRRQRRPDSDYGDDGFLTVMMLLYTAVIILGTLVFERFWRQWSRWIQSQPTGVNDEAEVARRKRSQAYAEVRNQIRQADRARRAAADRLLELQMKDEEERELEVSRRRSVMRTQRFDAFTRTDRSRTPTRSSPTRNLNPLREEDDLRTEEYASPSYSDDEMQRLSEGRGETSLRSGVAREEEETPDLFAEDGSAEERLRGTPERRSRATAEVPGSPGDGQDLRRHLEMRELERYHRSIHEENYEELRRQHRIEGRSLPTRDPGDSSDTRATSTITPTEEEELFPNIFEEEDQEQHGQPGAVEDPVLGDPMLQGEEEGNRLEDIQEEMSVGEEGEEGEEETPEFDPPPPEGEEDTPEPVEEIPSEPRPNSGSPGEPEPEDEDQSYLPEYSAFVTGGGNCYHSNMMCCTLASTRTLRRSSWCPVCARITDRERYRMAYIVRQGADAHMDQQCAALQGQFAIPYRHCQRCGTFPTRRTQEG